MARKNKEKVKKGIIGNVAVRDQKYEMVPITQLIPHPDNPRRGNMEALEESIMQNGFYGAVVVQRGTNYILAGNHRWHAAVKLGITKLPVIWIDCDEKVAKRILLADNRTSDLAEYDDVKLAELLRELKEEGLLLGTGYDDEDVEAMLEALNDEPYYTRKVEVPIYEPREPVPPPVLSLYDRSRYDELIERIEKADIPEDVREFLRFAATRHIRFRYDRIAEFYAHAPREIKDLFEDSALVIIDFNQAIEKGFVRLVEELAEEYRREYGEDGGG